MSLNTQKIKDEILNTLNKRVLLCDGAMGTMLQSIGYTAASDLLNLDENARKDIIKIHLNYIAAGSEIIQTNTFGANFLKLKRSGNEKYLKLINKNAVNNVKEAINYFQEFSPNKETVKRIYIAGDIGPSGEMLKPFGNISYDEMANSFSAQAEVLIESGVDFILVETMMDLNEACAAVEGIKKLDREILIACTLTFNENGVTLMGNKAEDFGKVLIDAGCSIIGANCSVGSSSMIKITEKIRSANPDTLLIIQPNAGLPKIVNNKTIFDESPDLMAENFSHILKFNPSIIGGCCGSTPEHIKKISNLLKNDS